MNKAIRYGLSSFFFIFQIINTNPLHAQVHQRTEAADTATQLQQVVVTGTGTHRRMADSPVPVTVITARELAASNASTIEEALVKLSPSISTFTNGMGSTMSLNGVNDDYILIMVNGRRLSGDDRLTRVPVANVRRIEILNGAASALYGSDAIAGVINIITEDGTGTVDANSYTHVATHGRLTENTNLDVNVGHFSSHTSYQRRQASNWQNNGIDENGYETDKPTSAGYYQNIFDQRFDVKATDRLTFSAFGTWYDYQTRRPRDAMYYSSGKQRQAYTYNLRHDTYSYGASAKYLISRRAYINAEFLSDHYRSQYRYFTDSGSYVAGDEITRKKTHRNSFTLKGIFWLGKINKLSVGAEWVGDQLRSESDNIQWKNQNTYSLMAQDELNINRHWQAVVGLRYIYNENFNSYATPNASLMYRVGHLNVRAAYASGFRTPTLSQLYATDLTKTSNRYTLGNTDLKPEKSHFVQLNAEWVQGRWTLGVTGFFNRMRDMINYRTLSEEEIAAMPNASDLAQYDEVRQRDNVDKARTTGVTLNAQCRIGWGLSVGGAYTYIDSQSKERQTDGTMEKSPIDKSIKHAGRLNASWGHTWGKYTLDVNVAGQVQGRRYSQTYGYAPKYNTWDLNTRHTVRLGRVNLEPGLGIENIFDKRDRRPWNNNFSTLTPGRSVYGTLLVRFH